MIALVLMIIVKIAIVVLQVSILLVVFSLGLETPFSEATYLFRRPWLLVRSLLAMNVVMPLVAGVMDATFPLYPAVKVALVFLALAPVPPLLPHQQLKAGGNAAYVHGLLVAVSLLSVVLVPLTIAVLDRAFGQDIHFSPLAVAKTMAKPIGLPLAAGMLVRHFAPGLAGKSGASLSGVAVLLLLGAAAVMLVVSLPEIFAMIGNGTVLAIAAFVVAGATAGHLLGGPDPAERSTLALATASRHPGLAVAIASATYPGQRKQVAAVIILYLLVKAVVLIPYNSWRKRSLVSAGRRAAIEPTQRAA